MDLTRITQALYKSWSAETSYKRMAVPGNMARGQCVVSSLIVQDLLGGELCRVAVKGDGIDENHYFNVLANGTIIDTSGCQYKDLQVSFVPAPVNLSEYASIREKVLADTDTQDRYLCLKKAVERVLHENP